MPEFVERAFITTKYPNLDTWHRRLGHTNIQSIEDMVRKDLVKGMRVDMSSSPTSCEHCILGKQVKKAVPKIREGTKSSRVLGVVYVDLTGPMDVKSAGGNLYCMDIIDDCSSFHWSIPLPSKDTAFLQLKAWQLSVEAETGQKVGIYRVDNGELKSKSMKEWLETCGIQQQFTAPYTSAHIGRVERLHRTIANKARAMRLQIDLPPNCWDEMMVTACYLSVRTPSRSARGHTPYELYYGHQPNLAHLREIGSRAFVLIQNHNNPKIYARSVECVLVGYAPNAKAYRCYHRASHKIYTSYNVVFIESNDTMPHPLHPGLILGSDAPSEIPAPDVLPEVEPIIPDEPEPGPSEPHIPSLPTALVPPQPARRSSRITVPSDKAASISGFDKVSSLSRAVEAVRESAERIHAHRTSARTQRTTPNNHAPIDPLPDLVDIPDNPVDELLAAMDPLTADMCNPADPQSMAEALASPDAEQWKLTLIEEFNALKDLGVYKLVPRSTVPAGRKIMRGKAVFHQKTDEFGTIVRYKCRYVCRGFSAVYGQDYTKTTSPTARMESFRVLLHLGASLDMDIQQIDVKTAFLYSILSNDEICYMEQPEGYREKGHEDWVWELQKGLYGMKQGGRVWNKTMNDAMINWGFTRLPCEYCIYYCKTDTGVIITGVHVDNFISLGTDAAENERFKAEPWLRKILYRYCY
jgi:hypothetical protein